MTRAVAWASPRDTWDRLPMLHSNGSTLRERFVHIGSSVQGQGEGISLIIRCHGSWSELVINALILKDPRDLRSIVMMMILVHLLLELLHMLIWNHLPLPVTAHLLRGAIYCSWHIWSSIECSLRRLWCISSRIWRLSRQKLWWQKILIIVIGWYQVVLSSASSSAIEAV